ncbi:MAG: DNA adenine methylase [Cyclobacteriaceae bacterium]|nr:DNA adenine methylase [Cyclobacteriaceae bacterium]
MKLVLSRNNLLDGHYIELYAGGAAIAWSLLFEEYVRHVHINDLNKSVYAFWQSVLEKTDDLCRLVWDTRVSMRQWHRQRLIQAHPDEYSQLELGFSTFFLNRTNRSGILNAGVIGGKKQRGEWKIDARYNKADLVGRIQKLAAYRGRIHLYNLDAAQFIKSHLRHLPKKTLVYMDPPYYVKGRDLYEDHYCHEDHVEVAKLVSTKIRQPWIVSYDAVKEIKRLYKGTKAIEYRLSYSAQDRYAGSEIMYFAKSLNLPKIKSPTQISPREFKQQLVC